KKTTADREKKLGLSRGRKTLVAYTSSLDEFVASRGVLEALGRPYAAGPKPFDDQSAWLRALVDWTASRPDLQLVGRIHPRTGSSRYATVASEYFRLKSEFATTPSNVTVVWPEDPVSRYNLGDI